MNKTLKDCCTFQEGYVNPPQNNSEYFDGEIKWLRTVDLNDGFVYSTSRNLSEKGFLSAGKSAFMFPKDTLAISKSGTIGTLGVLKDTMCGNRAVININVNKDKVPMLYIYYLLKYKRPEIIKKAVGSIQKNLYVSALETVELCHDDLFEQEKIATSLSRIDNKIELNNKICKELELLAKLIYDYWFVQFDFPNEHGKPYKSSGGNMVWNDELKKAVPEGWINGSLKDIANIISGQSPEGKSYNELGEGMVFYQGRTDFNDRFPTIRMYTTEPTRIAQVDDILLSVRAPVGDVNITNEKCCIGRGLAALRSKQNCNSYLFYLMLKLKPNFEIYNGNGTTFGAISKDDLEDIGVLLPNELIVRKFENCVNKYDKLIKAKSIENQELIKLRDWLLPMLMNGQVGFKKDGVVGNNCI